jgi:hypothetical protein
MWVSPPGNSIDLSKLNENPILFSNPNRIEKVIVSPSGTVFLLQNYDTVHGLSCPTSTLVNSCEYFLLKNMQLIVSIYFEIYLISVECHSIFQSCLQT